MRKGQLTAIIIIVLIIVAGIGILLFTRTVTIEEELSVQEQILSNSPAEIKPVVKYVQECIKKVSLPVLELLGVQGGYVKLPDVHLEGVNDVGYGYFTGLNVLPSKQEVEVELSTYMNIAIKDCINWSIFQGFKVEEGEMNTDSSILKNKVRHRIEYPLTIKVEDQVHEIKDFRYELDIRLGEMIDAANLIIENLDPETIDLSYLAEFDFDVNIIPIDLSNLIYSLTDDKVKIGSKSYVFMFGAKYKLNQKPTFEVEDEYFLVDGDNFTLQLNGFDPDGDVLEFSDNTALFDISSDGLIEVTPEITGEYLVEITVTDAKGSFEIKEVKFVVEE